MQLSAYVRIVPITTLAQGAAGQTQIVSSIVDTQSFASGLFIVPVGTITAGGEQSLKLEHSDAADMSGAKPVAYSNQVVLDADSGTVRYIDVRRFGRRYVRLTINRATQNSSFGPVVCQLYEAVAAPTSHAAGVTGEVLPSAGDGYA